MSYPKARMFAAALLAVGGTIGLAAQDPAPQANCKAVHADLVEDLSRTECKPGHTSCFLGVVDGNQGLRGTTYFRADSGNLGPSTSPDFRIYSGVFEYTTDRGTLAMRETGVSNPTVGSPDMGVVTAFQRIQSGTGDFAGATGYFFVSGFNVNNHVVTKLFGEICTP